MDATRASDTQTYTSGAFNYKNSHGVIPWVHEFVFHVNFGTKHSHTNTWRCHAGKMMTNGYFSFSRKPPAIITLRKNALHDLREKSPNHQSISLPTESIALCFDQTPNNCGEVRC